MAITMVSPITPFNPKAPATPAVPNPDQQKKQIEDLKKNQTEINKIKKDTDKTLSEINKNVDNTFGKAAAKQLCLLRLDMIADKLDKIYPKWANQLDKITTRLDSDWEV